MYWVELVLTLLYKWSDAIGQTSLFIMTEQSPGELGGRAEAVVSWHWE